MAIRKVRSTVCAALGLALATLASGCGSEEKAAAPTPTPATAPAPQAAAPQAAAVREAPPEEAPAEAPRPTTDYPGDFPTDVPRYPGSKVTSARGSADEGFAVTIDAPGGVAEVAKFYGDGLGASGWAAEVQESPDGTMIIAVKEGERAQALVQQGGQGAVVELIVGRVE